MLLPFFFILSLIFVPDNGKDFTEPLAYLLILLDFLFKNLYLTHCLKVHGEDRAYTYLTFNL